MKDYALYPKQINTSKTTMDLRCVVPLHLPVQDLHVRGFFYCFSVSQNIQCIENVRAACLMLAYSVPLFFVAAVRLLRFLLCGLVNFMNSVTQAYQ